MSENPPKTTNLTERGKAEAEARAERLAAQLRANLKRRKEQQRNRAEPPAGETSGQDE